MFGRLRSEGENMTIGLRIKRMRKFHDMSRRELSEKIGISPEALRYCEIGATQPKTDTIIKIADFFDVTTDFLIFGKDKVPNSNNKYEAYLKYSDEV